MNDQVKHLITKSLQVLRDNQASLHKNAHRLIEFEGIDWYQQTDDDLVEAVDRVAFPEEYKDMTYLTNYTNGEELFNKALSGRVLHLITFDGRVQVDVKIKENHALGMSVKPPEQRKFGPLKFHDANYIINYLAQFRERD